MKLFIIVITIICFIVNAIPIVEAVKPKGLLLYFPFDEGAGDKAKDLSDNGFDGKLNGPKWTDGKFGKALDFNGVSDFVSIDPIKLNPDELTIEMWFKPGAEIKAGARQDLIYRRTGSGRPHITFNRAGDGMLGFYIYLKKDASEHQVTTKTAAWSAGTWYHVAATSLPGELKIYINGKLENTQATPKDALDVQYDKNGMVIGSRYGTETFFKGAIDEVRLWSRVLNADEVKQAFDGTLLAVEPVGKLAVKWGQMKSFSLTQNSRN